MYGLCFLSFYKAYHSTAYLYKIIINKGIRPPYIAAYYYFGLGVKWKYADTFEVIAMLDQDHVHIL